MLYDSPTVTTSIATSCATSSKLRRPCYADVARGVITLLNSCNGSSGLDDSQNI